jgi:hypothetical protein
MGKDLEGSGHDLISILSWHLPLELRSTMETIRKDSVLAEVSTELVQDIS